MNPFTLVGNNRVKLPRLYPPLWFLLFAGTALGLEQTLVLSMDLGVVVATGALMLVVVGSLFPVWAISLFRRAHTTVDPFGNASRLVTRGPYRFSRNPMYLGLLLTLTALVLWLENLSGLFLPPLFMLVITRCHIQPEEERLKRLFGDAYLNYQEQTRRWI